MIDKDEYRETDEEIIGSLRDEILQTKEARYIKRSTAEDYEQLLFAVRQKNSPSDDVLEVALYKTIRRQEKPSVRVPRAWFKLLYSLWNKAKGVCSWR